MPDEEEPAPPDPDAPDLPVLIRRLITGLVALFTVMAVLGYFLSEPLELISAAFIDRFGRAGLFFGVLLLDCLPFTTHEPFLFLGYSGGMRFWAVAGLAGTASWLSGALGWSMGRLLARWSWLRNLFERHHVGPFLRKYGTAAIAVAALTPFPYAITTWGSGACGVRLGQVMLGALFRYPKVLFYLTVIALGWEVST